MNANMSSFLPHETQKSYRHLLYPRPCPHQGQCKLKLPRSPAVAAGAWLLQILIRILMINFWSLESY